MKPIEHVTEYLSKKYFLLLFVHVLIGIAIYGFPAISKIYGYLIFFCSIAIIIINKNKNNEVLYAAAYAVGSEVFLRMTSGAPAHEFGKYSLILYGIIGLYYSGFYKNGMAYWIYIVLILPGVILSIVTLKDLQLKKIVFDISGPVSLAIFSIYAYKRPVTSKQINAVLLAIGLPILSCCIYLSLSCPTGDNIYLNTVSSFLLSGNFGPNQVATILGLGMFIFFARLILNSRSGSYLIVNLLISAYIGYRGLITFSRGGMLTALAMIIFFLIVVFFDFKYYERFQLKYKLVFYALSFTGVFLLTSYQSEGLIIRRYANEDPYGNPKRESDFGRSKLAKREINVFFENPVLGIGVGKDKENSVRDLGKSMATHNEFTRMLSEHGILGLAAMLILVIVPLLAFGQNKHNIYFLSFYLFWLLTITHTGMRVAAPSFLYALSLLHIQLKKDT